MDSVLGTRAVRLHDSGHVSGDLRYAPRVPLVFVAGSAAEVFAPDLATAVESAVRARFPSLPEAHGDTYRSEIVEAAGWSLLQARVLKTLAAAPHLTGIDAYQSVYLPLRFADVAHVAIAGAADPLEAASLDSLIDELRAFAAEAQLPTDDVELMQLAAHYLEDDALFDSDLDVQTYVQLFLAARQAAAHTSPLWIAAE
jgi:hypothetical protein